MPKHPFPIPDLVKNVIGSAGETIKVTPQSDPVKVTGAGAGKVAGQPIKSPVPIPDYITDALASTGDTIKTEITPAKTIKPPKPF